MDSNSVKHNVLIVEDELLIAHAIKKMLTPNYLIEDLVMNYEDAINILSNKKIDIALLDINISGDKNGIDIANYINLNIKIPFIFLTALSNNSILNQLLDSKPAAYLSKPINKPDLYTAIHLALINHKKDVNKINIHTGTHIHTLDLNKVLYIQAEHVYCNVTSLVENENDTIRISLNDIVDQAEPHLERINRSTVINPRFIKSQSFSKITMINNAVFTLSKLYK